MEKIGIPAKKRYNGVDIMRSIAVFFVVVYHLPQISLNTGSVFFDLLNITLSSVMAVSMPIFFFLTGYFAFRERKTDIKKYFSDILKLMLVILFWILLTTNILCGVRGADMSVKEFLETAFLLKEGWSTHFWYLYFFLGVKLVLPLFNFIYRKNSKVFLIMAIIILALTCLYIIAKNILFGVFLTGQISIDVENSIIAAFKEVSRLCYIFASVALGGLCKKYCDILKTDKVKKYLCLITLVSGIVFLVRNYFAVQLLPEAFYRGEGSCCSVFALIAPVFLIAYLSDVKDTKLTSALAFLGRNSFGIYLLHWIVNYSFGEAIIGMVSYTAATSALTIYTFALMNCIFSGLFVNIMCRYRYTAKLFLR